MQISRNLQAILVHCMLFLAMSSTGLAQRVSSGLIIYYPLTEGSGTSVTDQSGYGSPLDLSTTYGTFSWISGRNGIVITQDCRIQSSGAASKLISEAKASNEITVEVWCKPAYLNIDHSQGLVVNSLSTSYKRNFALFPDNDDISVRVRTSNDGNSGSPYLWTYNTIQLAETHFVFTYDNNEEVKFYQNGSLKGTRSHSGNFSNWDDTYFLFLASDNDNGGGSRFWLGELYLVAIYNRALSAAEILQNYNAGSIVGGGGGGGATPPAAPTGLAANAVSTGQIDLSWTDNASDETGFKIERKQGTGAFAEIATVSANVTTYSNTGLNAGTMYTYRVRAYNSAGNSSYSNEASATTQPPPEQPPAAPSNLTATAVSSSQINLSWTDNSGDETGFKISRKEGANGSYSEIATAGANVTNYSDTGLSAQTTYYYKVLAYNGAGNSGESNEANATTDAPSSGELWTLKDGTNDIYYDQGKVGIGTNAPNGVLHLYTSTKDDAILMNLGAESKGERFQMRIHATGTDYLNITRGTTTLMSISEGGTITAKELILQSNGADFVFDDGYRLMPLDEVAQHIKTNKHLPGLPPAKETQKRGMNIAEMQTKLLQKIEELTLYVIELKQENEGLQKRLHTVEHRQ